MAGFSASSDEKLSETVGLCGKSYFTLLTSGCQISRRPDPTFYRMRPSSTTAGQMAPGRRVIQVQWCVFERLGEREKELWESTSAEFLSGQRELTGQDVKVLQVELAFPQAACGR